MIARRNVLKALGLTACSFALPSIGRAAPSRPRLVVYTTSHGTVYDQWRLRPGGVGDDVDFEADLEELSPILAPLASYASRLLVLDGLADIEALNPYLKGDRTPDRTGYPVRVPRGAGDRVALALTGSGDEPSSPLTAERGRMAE